MGGARRYEFPYCLSIVIVKIQDIIFKGDLKKESKIDVDTVRYMRDDQILAGNEMPSASEVPDLQDT